MPNDAVPGDMHQNRKRNRKPFPRQARRPSPPTNSYQTNRQEAGGLPRHEFARLLKRSSGLDVDYWSDNKRESSLEK